MLRLALFHTTFHLLGVILFLPFYQTFARRLLKWIPSRSEKLTRLLDKNMSQLPTVALEAARRSLLDIERYLGNETELLVREGRLREDELTLVDKTLSDVRVFLSTIRLEDDGKQNDYGQHLSLLHTIDHLERWLYILREVEPVHSLRDTDFLAARELVLHELDLVNQLNHHTPPEDSKQWKQVSKQLAEYRKSHRSELLEETAVNQLEMDQTIQKVQVLLWLDRIGYHIWRATRHLSELLATYLLHSLKWELLGKTMLLPATVIYQARRAVPALNGCQSANINRLRLALMSRSWCAPQAHVHSRTSIVFFSPLTPQEEQICVDAYQGSALMSVRP